MVNRKIDKQTMSDPPSSIQPLSNQPSPAQLSESEKKRRKQNVARSKRFR